MNACIAKFLKPGAAIVMLILASCNSADKKNDHPIDSDSSNAVKDIDGNIYHIVKIADQQWLLENLKVTHYRNGDPILNLKDSATWLNTADGAYCNYNNDSTLAQIYGRLYNWNAVNDKRNICPQGWHVPSDSEFSILNSRFGGTQNSANALKEAGCVHWHEPNAHATNESGFCGLPGGHRSDDGTFERLGTYAFFWNSNVYKAYNDTAMAHECSLNYSLSYFNQDWGAKVRGMSVRCIKDVP